MVAFARISMAADVKTEEMQEGAKDVVAAHSLTVGQGNGS